MSDIRKVIFRLQQHKDGFPPIAIEMLNARQISQETFQICNAPYFVENISYHDVVLAQRTDITGQFEFVRVLEQSEFTSISVILLDNSMDQLLMDLLRGLDCVVEYGEFGVYRVLAAAVPPTCNYSSLRARLVDLEDRGMISFAELSLSEQAKIQSNEH